MRKHIIDLKGCGTMSEVRSVARNRSAPRLLLDHFRKPWGIPALALVTVCLQAQQVPELQSARQAMEAKQYAAAEQDYRKALAQTPSSAEIMTDLGVSLQMQGLSLIHI